MVLEFNDFLCSFVFLKQFIGSYDSPEALKLDLDLASNDLQINETIDDILGTSKDNRNENYKYFYENNYRHIKAIKILTLDRDVSI